LILVYTIAPGEWHQSSSPDIGARQPYSPLNGMSPFSPIIEAAASAQGGKRQPGLL
jgi:hypothetical protein